MVALVGILLAPAVQAQSRPGVEPLDLATYYKKARLQRLFDQIFAEHGLRAGPLPPAPVVIPSDTLMAWLAQYLPHRPPPPRPKPPLAISSWQLVKRIERLQYSTDFESVEWAYLGNNDRTSIDTTFTAHLRARMQGRFGAPTRTLVELDFTRNLRMEEYIQFEYWFVLNDTIPVVVMDVNGPFDRGFVFAADQAYREKLFELREKFLGGLMEEQPAPYVDYYYNYRARRWYRTGYDGEQFFTDPIGQPNLARGRPQLSQRGG